jgi:predicted AAA+ superfamily ATPase
MFNHLVRRQVLDRITPFLNSDDVIIIHGARQVGKTSILMVLQNDLGALNRPTLYLDLEDSRLTATLDQGVATFLTYLGERGLDLSAAERSGSKLTILIDEIQYLANPSSFLKLLADHHRYLKLIVSGSSSFEMKSKFRDSLVGRTVNFEIYPLSFAEFLNFKNEPFQPSQRYSPIRIAELRALYSEYVRYGGYPKIVLAPDPAIKEIYLQQIIDTYIRKDIRDLAQIRDVDKFNRLIEILASQSGSLLNVAELTNTCALTRETVERYLFLLEQTYILRLVRPFHSNLRSELTKTPKIYFYDTGLMQMLWLKHLQREILGTVFETSIFTELVKVYGVDSLRFWRTQDKKEIDFILNLPEGPQPVEVKLQFPRALPAVLQTFQQAYSAPQGWAVGLNGTPAGDGMIYPWQLIR